MKLYCYPSASEANTILKQGFRDHAWQLDYLQPKKVFPAVHLSASAPTGTEIVRGVLLEVTLSLSEDELAHQALRQEGAAGATWYVPAALLNEHADTRVILVGERRYESRLAARIIVDPEFAALIPPLTQEESDKLTASIRAHGCRDPLVVWPTSEGDILLDGHNRYACCVSYQVPFGIVAAPGVHTRDDAVRWMIDNQLARRNLTPDQASYLRGQRYNRSKMVGFRGNQHVGGRDQNDTDHSTATVLASEYKVSAPTIKRDGQFAAAVDTLAETVGPEIRQTILAGDSPLPKQDVIAVAQAAPEEQRHVFAFANEADMLAAAREVQDRRAAERRQIRANVAVLDENEDETRKRAKGAYEEYKKANAISRIIWRAHTLVGIPPRDAAARVAREIDGALMGIFSGLEKEAVDDLIVWLQDYSRTLGQQGESSRLLPPAPRRLLAVPPMREDSPDLPVDDIGDEGPPD